MTYCYIVVVIPYYLSLGWVGGKGSWEEGSRGLRPWLYRYRTANDARRQRYFSSVGLDRERSVATADSDDAITDRFSENHLCGAKELFASPRKIFRIPSPLYIETLRKSAENPVFSARVSFFAQDCVFSPKIGHFAWLASSFSRRSTIDRSCIASRLDVRLTNGRRRMPSLVVGGGVRARKPPSAPSSAC